MENIFGSHKNIVQFIYDIFSIFKKQNRHKEGDIDAGFKKKTPMLPIEKGPHFPDYFNDNQTNPPYGNVLFP